MAESLRNYQSCCTVLVWPKLSDFGSNLASLCLWFFLDKIGLIMSELREIIKNSLIKNETLFEKACWEIWKIWISRSSLNCPPSNQQARLTRVFSCSMPAACPTLNCKFYRLLSSTASHFCPYQSSYRLTKSQFCLFPSLFMPVTIVIV